MCSEIINCGARVWAWAVFTCSAPVPLTYSSTAFFSRGFRELSIIAVGRIATSASERWERSCAFRRLPLRLKMLSLFTALTRRGFIRASRSLGQETFSACERWAASDVGSVGTVTCKRLRLRNLAELLVFSTGAYLDNSTAIIAAFASALRWAECTVFCAGLTYSY